MDCCVKCTSSRVHSGRPPGSETRFVRLTTFPRTDATNGTKGNFYTSVPYLHPQKSYSVSVSGNLALVSVRRSVLQRY